MARGGETQVEQPGLAVETVSRMPQQGRSKASLERMLSAARELMLERGSEDFTLQDVNQRGNVSIGSIYLRFQSKENLVRAVIARALEDLAQTEEAMVQDVLSQSPTLDEFMPRYVAGYAEVLRVNAPLLRLAMERASFDPLVSKPGKDHALRATERGMQAMLQYRADFGGSDHETKANSAYKVVFATMARQLSLGSSGEAAHDYDWEVLKRELGRMCLAYLRAP
ncbi:TetR/AcrR family transcriptional regulator [Novosphingobium taihuense]|uniref:AcrR family transcriptional regulator n=1 Tax=Novosphingobium taihuense TaxID=260085 RepID=A0A7W7AF23_9SPHN|nr:TetR/AcrR family transcriptional regulator [Novosphingobium taihuense]MBB4615849.1 AcrR family transcriptional regulator [Novosphingobium taihuense]TWH79107.1 TetR family transcriptional regulator [Novosphingobium taihuense]